MSEKNKRIYVYSLSMLTLLYHRLSGMDTLVILIAAAMIVGTYEVTLKFRGRKG